MTKVNSLTLSCSFVKGHCCWFSHHTINERRIINGWMSNGGPYSRGSSIQTYVTVQAIDEIVFILDADNTFAGEVIKGDVSSGDETAGTARDGHTIAQEVIPEHVRIGTIWT